MHKAFQVLLLMAAGVLVGGCAMEPYTYTVARVPMTPQNMETYRQCLHTEAVAVGYDESGFQSLKRKCRSTLVDVSYQTVEGFPDTPEGCNQVESIDNTFYFFCPAQ